VNRLVARIAEAKRTATGDVLARLTALEAQLLTPPVRYSRPGLQAHIAYLYGIEPQTDQRIGRDVVERYAVLRRDLDAAQAEARALIGPEPPGWNPSRAPAPPAPDDDDDSDES
jgi:hypothetical protein